MYFKLFGGVMMIFFEEGFIVVIGFNGFGKSNIFDGVLFCLGLVISCGMWVECLLDLVNSGMFKVGKVVEIIVSVCFDLSDWIFDVVEEGLEVLVEGFWI